MGLSNKTLAYAAIGFGALVIGYFIYKNALTKGAQEALSGGLSGFGGMSKTFLGDMGFDAPFLSKKESQTAISQMKGAPSPVPPHSPAVRTIQGAPFSAASANKAAAPVASMPEARMNVNKAVQTQTSSNIRPAIVGGRTVTTPRVTKQAAITNRITDRKPVAPAMSKQVVSRLTAGKAVPSGARSRLQRYASGNSRVGRSFYSR